MTWQLALALGANLIAVILGVSKGISTLVALRDEIRDMHAAIGSQTPRTGLVGDIFQLRDDLGVIRREVLSHRDTLIEVTAQLNLRRPGGRT